MSTDDDSIEKRVGDALRATDGTLALAEASTGGLIGSLLTDVPGASAFFDRAFVAYAYDANRTLLGVTRETLDTHGAVSEACTREMAKAARDRADVTWGLAATGILGPDGGTAEKPVGTTFSAVAYAGEWDTGTTETVSSRYAFNGDRETVKTELARAALRSLSEAIDERR